MPEKRPLKVVIVDDSRADTIVFQRFLAHDPEHEFHVHSATSGAAGIQLVETERPDCVLLDYRLPDMTGLEVLSRLRGQLKIQSVPVVMLTGSVDESLVVRALKSGAQDYLSKAELTAENLLRALHLAIERVVVVRKMEDALHARDEFLSIASHEMKTPLTTLVLQMQQASILLARGAHNPQGEQVQRILSRATAQLNRLAGLVENLLDVSRISVGRLDFDAEQVDLAAMVRGVVERLSEQLAAVGCALEFHAAAEVMGAFDRFRLEQVVVNLVSNAIKYASGKPVFVAVRQESGWGVIEVRDQGIGISAAQQAKIFDRFDRGLAPKGTQGLGLGLYIAKKIVDLHAGTLEVESEPGAGATFTVRIPLAAARIVA